MGAAIIDFGRTRGAIVAFERDADPLIGQRGAEYTFRACLHEHARAEPLT